MTWNIIEGDCLEVLKSYPDNYFSAIVTDPPYGLSFMGKGWDHAVPGVEYWRECKRICRPGSFILAMGGTRTFHRLTCSIEDAGWEVRDCLMYLYGSGFPKSHNFGCKCTGEPVPYSHEKTKSLSKSCLRSLPESDLSPTINSSDKQKKVLFTSMSEQDLQSSWPMPIEGNETRKKSCLEGGNNLQEEQRELHRPEVCEMSTRIPSDGEKGRICDGTSSSNGEISQAYTSASGSCSSQGSQHKKQQYRKSRIVSRQQDAQNNRMAACEKCGGLLDWKGYGTALKPAWEPIIMAMKPCDGTFAQNAEKWGQAGINIDGCRIGENPGYSYPNGKGGSKFFNGLNTEHCPMSSKGRWPANLILDEEAAKMLDEQSGTLKSGSLKPYKRESNDYYSGSWPDSEYKSNATQGGASRFFYCAKASSSERNEGLEGLPEKENMRTNAPRESEESKHSKLMMNHHPTVKPLKLMEYLIKLVMPPKDGILLDPFAGSGTTILAAKRLGFSAIGIEKEHEYCDIARKRLEDKKGNQYELLS